METETIIQKVLHNDYAQVVSIVVVVWYCFNSVILPIANTNFQLAEIKSTLEDIKTINGNFDARITTNANDILVIKEKLSKYNIK